ncbi:hypothetical protein CHELA20_52812 [Hyphomicrobiales bacterium]|nr:hypothetical protein CHELA41_22113 [Hyphomicrobiales bacterium]CAH1682994.1 hypothetical protein CHELA20_52812 [Hyphomicrobiales bacterium]
MFIAHSHPTLILSHSENGQGPNNGHDQCKDMARANGQAWDPALGPQGRDLPGARIPR